MEFPLSSISNVMVYEGYVFATDEFANRVAIFTPEGEYLTEFGVHVEAGDTDSHAALGLAHDGEFLYMVDNRQHKVQIFELGFLAVTETKTVEELPVPIQSEFVFLSLITSVIIVRKVKNSR